MKRGPLLMILATLAFTAMVACVKLAREEMSGLELVFWRGVISTPLVFVMMRGAGFALRNRRVFGLRLACGLGAMTCFYVAVRGMDLLDLNLVARLQPLLVGIGAPLLLGTDERGGARIWIAAIGGFVGCAIILAPGLSIGSWYGLAALGATFFSAAAHVSLRRLAPDDHGRTIVFWFHVGLALAAGLGVAVVYRGVPLPPSHLWPQVLGVGVFATIGQLLVTKAYASDRAPVVAAASYAGILFALVADLAIFERAPGLSALVGGTLVVAATALTLAPGRRRRARSAA